MDQVKVKYYEGEKTGIDKAIVHIIIGEKIVTISEDVLLKNYEKTNEYGLCVSTCDGIKINWKYVKDGKKTVSREEADGIIARAYNSGEIKIELKRSNDYIKDIYDHRNCSGASVLESIERGTKRGEFY